MAQKELKDIIRGLEESGWNFVKDEEGNPKRVGMDFVLEDGEWKPKEMGFLVAPSEHPKKPEPYSLSALKEKLNEEVI